MKVKNLANQSREILGLLYDVAGVGMCVTGIDRRFVAVNREYCRTYGYDEDELLGREFTIVVPAEHKEAAAALHDDFLLRNRGEVSGEWQVIRKNATVATVLITAGRLETAGGEKFKVTTVYDITNREPRVPSPQRAADSLELREINHRVKNHLQSLQAMMSMEVQNARDDKKLAEILTLSINRINTMSRLYDRLQEKPDVKTVALKEYLSSLVDDIAETGERSQAAEISLEIDDLHVLIEQAVSVGLILNELITNSIKHNPVDSSPAAISVVLRGRERYIEVEVSDSGTGLPADFLETHHDTLGIQIIDAIVSKHGGSFELFDPGSSGFRVRLPRPRQD